MIAIWVAIAFLAYWALLYRAHTSHVTFKPDPVVFVAPAHAPTFTVVSLVEVCLADTLRFAMPSGLSFFR